MMSVVLAVSDRALGKVSGECFSQIKVSQTVRSSNQPMQSSDISVQLDDFAVGYGTGEIALDLFVFKYENPAPSLVFRYNSEDLW